MSPWLSDRLLRTQADERLAALSAEGHEAAFAALVNRHRGPLLAFARNLGSGAKAEDVVQQALMQAWLALQGGTQVAHVRGWLYQATRRAAWRAAAAPEADELPATVRAAADTESEVERRVEARRLLADLQLLPQRQRDALVGTALEGRAGPEVADELGLTDNAFRQLVFRARTALRTAAGALLPLPLVTWAAARGSSSSPMNERVAGLLGSGGAAGSAAGLTKLAVVASVAGVIAGGVAVRHALDEAPHPGVEARISAQHSTVGRPRPARRLRARPSPARDAKAHASRVRLLGREATTGAVPSPSGSAGGSTPPRQRSVAVRGESAESEPHAVSPAPASERTPSPQPSPEGDGEQAVSTSSEESSRFLESAPEGEDAPSPPEPGEDG